MTPEELLAKVEELRSAISEKISELEENPKWGSGDEREQMVNALDELMVQIESLSDALQTEADDVEGGDDD